ncbi:helix-turn-helix domain-containing protein [Spirillospora sp. NPDC050679]
MGTETLIDTGIVNPSKRLEFWQDSVSALHFPFAASADPLHDFHAVLRQVELGSVQLVHMTCSPLRAMRTTRMIQRADPERLDLNLILTGGAVHEQGDGVARVGPGDFFLRDSSRPYTTRRSCEETACTSESVAVRLPRAALPAHVAERVAVSLSGRSGTGALLADFISQSLRRSDEIPPSDRPMLGRVILDLVGALCSADADAGSLLAPQSRQQALLARVHAYIERHLADPGLTPRQIADAQQISLRYLHRLFQLEGDLGVAATIRRRRLERCRRDLADPDQMAVPVYAVAARWGFADQAHFSRAFRSAYGTSPLTYRHALATEGSAPGGKDCAPTGEDNTAGQADH